jgi:hypothetical protein
MTVGLMWRSLKKALSYLATGAKLGKNLTFKHKYFCVAISRV